MYHFDILNFSQNRLYFSGNKMNLYPQYSDYQLFYCCNDFPTNLPNTDFGLAQRSNTRFSFPQISYHSSMELLDYSSTFVGAFPRDAMDQRLMTSIKNRSIDPEPTMWIMIGMHFRFQILNRVLWIQIWMVCLIIGNNIMV